MLKKTILILLIILINYPNKIKADTNDSNLIKERYHNMYAVYEGSDRTRLFNAEKYTLNNITAYCIEPILPITTNLYSSTTNFDITGLQNDIINYIKLVAYYGYDYPNHNNMKYYLAAQELIWEKITGQNIYWIEGTNIGENLIDITKELTTIKELIANHNIKPSFNNTEITIDINTEKTIEDNNNVISNYKVYSSNFGIINIENNTLSVTAPLFSVTGRIDLIKKTYTDSMPLIYYNGDSQKFITSGSLEPIYANVKVKINYTSKLKVVKIDSETKEIIPISGIKFIIKDANTQAKICQSKNELDNCTYETDESGSFITKDKLPEGTYLLEEIEDQQINGYTWNNESKSIKFNKNTFFKFYNNEIIHEVNFENKQVLGKVTLEKIGEQFIIEDNNFHYEEKKLDNVTYNLYDNNKELIKQVTTNNGHLEIDNLRLGSYCLEEISNPSEYILDQTPQCFTLAYQDQYTEKVTLNLTHKNYLPKGNIIIIKKDLSNGKLLAGATIEIYTINNELISTKITDAEGKIYLSNLKAGKYYYKETIPPKGYKINNDIHYFEIKENDELVSTTIEDELINVPDTAKNRNIILNVTITIFNMIGINLVLYAKKVII